MSKGKQKDLPGMEDREIKELQETAVEYADVRDRRIQLQTGPNGEGALKQELLKLMKKHKLDRYHYQDVTILREVGEETVKVIIAKKKEKEAAD